jgi:hypothetical protein
MTKRKTSYANNAPNAGLYYDYVKAIDKVTPGSQYKKALPFKREKIDYVKLKRIIDLRAVKAPKEKLQGEKLRNHINKEDDWLIVELLMKTLMKKKQIKGDEPHRAHTEMSTQD